MKIAVASPSFSKNDILRGRLSDVFPDAIYNLNGIKLQGDSLYDFIKDADGIIVGLESIERNLLELCPTLKIISKYGVGLDNIDVEYCKQKNISVGWTPGINRTSVAEITIAFMITLMRNLYITSNQLKEGMWNKNGGHNLSGKTIGIIGVGNIGKTVVKFLKPFRNTILVNDIINQKNYYEANDLQAASKEDIYKESDIVTLHVPLTTETKNLINRDVLIRMKKSSFLINTARGQVVQKDDLKWALTNNIIMGAAIDVYDEEPPEDNELLRLPNLICTPHIGGNSNESVLSMGVSAIKHLVDFFKT